MLDIESKKYSSRKEYEYDDDIGVLFYKGTKITRCNMEDFRKSWIEESWNAECETMEEFLDDVVGDIDIELDDEDNEDTWENIWDKLDWNENTNSYKYKNWEIVVLDM